MAGVTAAVGGHAAGARRRAGWSTWWASALLSVGALVLGALTGGSLAVLLAVVALAFAGIGALVAGRHPGNLVGWLFCAVGVLTAADGVANGYALQALVRQPGSLPAGLAMAWLADWLWVPILGLAVPLLLLFFPDGRLPSPRWRRVLWLALGATPLAAAGFALTPGGLSSGQREIAQLHNPVGLPGAAGSLAAVLGVGGLVLLLVAAGLGVASLVVRFRRAGSDERQQIKWFAYGASLLGIVVVVGSAAWTLSPAARLAVPLSLVLAPLSAGVAILRYRLYDIDVVINRTLVFGVLAGFVTIVYVTIVVGIGAAVGQGSSPNPGLSIVATAVVAVAFQPVRIRAQRLANRLVYGHRATPYEVLSDLAHRMADALAAEDLAPRMARTLAEGTGAVATRIWLKVGERMVCEAAWPQDAAVPEPVALRDGELPALPDVSLALPVHHRGELLGALTLAKAAGDRLTPTEDKLARDVASQAGLALRNLRLTEELRARLDELQASRQRLVTAQDEERRRLERNLHDGAQQQLVALAVKARLARSLAAQDAAKAGQILEQVEQEASQALEDLRDLARGIYPPLLADAGLATALSSQVRRAALPVSIDADGIGRYSQERESAVYFCTLEALQNVAKYAGATAAAVRLREHDGMLAFEVSDDGAGFDPAARGYGTGLQGMADRLAALGGCLEVRSAPGAGTTVAGRIPVGR
jgi:signal transduction histidine kinase